MSSYILSAEEFFRLLHEDIEFCANVGKIMLSAGMLETNLRHYLRAKDVKSINDKSTLGRMVKILKKEGLLSKNGVTCFEGLAQNRNYLAHSIYDLFSKSIDVTILPRENLTERYIYNFNEKARQLAHDFAVFSDLVMNADIKKEVLL